MDTAIPEVILVVQVVSFILYTVVISLGLIWMKANPDRKFMEIPVILLTLHVLIFYIASWLNNGENLYLESPHTVFTSWSAILRLQTAITFLGLELLRAESLQVGKYVVAFLKLPFDLFSIIVNRKGKKGE